ncbi:IclR family transcriptional regulator [Shimia sediminis]|uniref:IclR family transcriptional regulator n=1 Tax=Shimia sediminis TaxID=2497945 RepID=UPI000F8E7594|nr:IclR family transcriptional regulator C-terminal domain-containing protein [Shimia sediminis]
MTTADKLLSVMKLFTIEEPEWTVEEATKRLSLSSSSTYRYFNSLSAFGLVEALNPGVYTLGPAIIEFDRMIRRQDQLVKTATPVMRRLVDLTDDSGSTLLCRKFRHQVMCVHSEGFVDPEKVLSYERGRPLGLFLGAASRVVLAYIPTRNLKVIFADHEAEIEAAGLGASWEEFRRNMKQIRNDSLVVAYGQLDLGKVGIAAPIFAANKSVIGSITLVLNEHEVNSQMVERLSIYVQAAAQEVTLGLSAAFNEKRPGSAGSDSAKPE